MIEAWNAECYLKEWGTYLNRDLECVDGEWCSRERDRRKKERGRK